MTGLNFAQETPLVDHQQVGGFWEGNAEVWATLSRLGYNVSRDEITMPAFLALLPDVAGLSGLDVGCGEGHGTRLLARGGARMRSEEHTSELQSRVDLVCRLLLEKKK